MKPLTSPLVDTSSANVRYVPGGPLPHKLNPVGYGPRREFKPGLSDIVHHGGDLGASRELQPNTDLLDLGI